MINVEFECDATVTITRAGNLIVATQHQGLLDDIAELPKPIYVHMFPSQGQALVELYGVNPKNLAKEIAKEWEAKGFKVKVIND